jgi:hypothetical protein
VQSFLVPGLRLGHGRDGVGRAQSVDDRKQDVVEGTIFQLVKSRERGAVSLFNPPAQHIRTPVGTDAHHEVHGLVLYHAFVTDCQAQRVEVDDRVHLKRPLLLPRDLFKYLIGARGNQVRRHASVDSTARHRASFNNPP